MLNQQCAYILERHDFHHSYISKQRPGNNLNECNDLYVDIFKFLVSQSRLNKIYNTKVSCTVCLHDNKLKMYHILLLSQISNLWWDTEAKCPTLPHQGNGSHTDKWVETRCRGRMTGIWSTLQSRGAQSASSRVRMGFEGSENLRKDSIGKVTKFLDKMVSNREGLHEAG